MLLLKCPHAGSRTYIAPWNWGAGGSRWSSEAQTGASYILHNNICGTNLFKNAHHSVNGSLPIRMNRYLLSTFHIVILDCVINFIPTVILMAIGIRNRRKAKYLCEVTMEEYLSDSHCTAVRRSICDDLITLNPKLFVPHELVSVFLKTCQFHCGPYTTHLGHWYWLVLTNVIFHISYQIKSNSNRTLFSLWFFL